MKRGIFHAGKEWRVLAAENHSAFQQAALTLLQGAEQKLHVIQTAKSSVKKFDTDKNFSSCD